jgi:S-adenosylmethionine synthetase
MPPTKPRPDAGDALLQPQDPGAHGRRSPFGRAPFLEPDAKSQVTLRYEGSLPVAATAVVVSTQHAPGYDEGEKEAELHAYVKRVVAEVIPPVLLRETVYYINPTGSFEIGGPDGDAGPDRAQDHRRYLWRRGPARRRRVLGQGPDQGRPLGRLYHPLSRQERRRGGLATRCTIQIAYAIGVSQPLSLYVDTHDTGTVATTGSKPRSWASPRSWAA